MLTSPAAPHAVTAINAKPAMKPRSYDDLSKQELIEQLKARDRKDATRFGLVWEADEIERDKALNSDFVALDLDLALSQGDGPWHNLIIEGDNYDALRALKLGFAGRVKCIYIDPPYNTGNKDFIYNDRFVDKEHAWRHSLWCEFMFRRLELAKDLLASDGVIFVSIDDNEVFHLGLLMNRVFGESNWISTMIWQKSYGGGAKAKHIVGLHEYVLCYALSKEQIPQISLPPNPDVLKYYKFSDAKLSQRGPYRLQPLATNSMDARPNLRFAIQYEGNEIWPEKQWQWSYDRVVSAIQNDELVIAKIKNRWSVNYKQYLRDENGEERASKLYSLQNGPFTQEGTSEVKAVFGDGKAFSFPKPTGLVESLLKILWNDKNSIVLDFFAGSGTTAHAVAKLNASDGGNRRFILVSSTEATFEEPHKNICRDVCAERVRRVMTGYGETAGMGGNFVYLRCRRIAESELIDIAHEQVWTALQLLHRESLQPYAAKPLHWREDESESEGLGALAYVERLGVGTMAELKRLIRSVPSALIYTWQAAALRSRLAPFEHVQIESIPQSLARKFGFKVS